MILAGVIFLSLMILESDVRDLRVMDLGDARVMVSGAATDEEFNDLLRAVANSEPLPTN